MSGTLAHRLELPRDELCEGRFGGGRRNLLNVSPLQRGEEFFGFTESVVGSVSGILGHAGSGPIPSGISGR
jgi:hypothetical protein